VTKTETAKAEVVAAFAAELNALTPGQVASWLALKSAEQAVLDACEKLNIRYDSQSGDLVISGDITVAHAELLRRKVLRGE
jgi:hypothetical protein